MGGLDQARSLRRQHATEPPPPRPEARIRLRPEAREGACRLRVCPWRGERAPALAFLMASPSVGPVVTTPGKSGKVCAEVGVSLFVDDGDIVLPNGALPHARVVRASRSRFVAGRRVLWASSCLDTGLAQPVANHFPGRKI
jgi:hypothetical protein